jgi:serine/threonine protein kinase
MNKLKQPYLANYGAGEPLGNKSGQGELLFVPNRANPKGILKRLIEKSEGEDRSQARSRMVEEIKNQKKLKQAGAKVPEVFESNEKDKLDLETELYFVMELIPGPTLDELITPQDKAPRNLRFEESVKVCLELTKTLRIAHGMQILHRDLKPKNIVVRNLETFDIVVLDWGISCDLVSAPALTTVNEQFKNEFIGLPERKNLGGDKRNLRSDLTDVVCILYYCLTAQPVISLRDHHDLSVHKAFSAMLKNKCSEAQFGKLDIFFDKGFQADIRMRFQTVKELERRLFELLDSGSSATSEELQSKLNRAIKHSQKNPKTQISNFKDKIEKQIPDFEQALNGLSDNSLPVVAKLPGSFFLDSMQLNFSLPNKNKNQDIVLLTMDLGERFMQNYNTERIYLYQLVVRKEVNKITFLIEYEFQLEENECVVYRTVLEQMGNFRENIVERLPVKRFSSPDVTTLVSLIADVEKAVGICIDKITGTI